MGANEMSTTLALRARRAGRDGRGRTALVMGCGELAVALRDRVDRAYLTLCDVRPAEMLATAGDCHPWPWMVIGDTRALAPDVSGWLSLHPVLVFWQGPAPPGLPAHTRAFERFADLAAGVEAALLVDVEGVRLAPGGGLTMPDGTHAGNAGLEALVAGHPRPVFAPARDFQGAVASLRSHGVALRLSRHRGATSLVSAQGD
jgi:hypothetical protein